MAFQTHDVVPILRDGNCLFRAVSYCIHRTQNFHRKFLLRIIKNVIEKWSLFGGFIVGDSAYPDLIQNAIDYQRVMSKDGRHGGHAELHSLSDLFPDCTFRIHFENIDTTTDYGSGNNVHNLLFSGDLDAGHYNVLKIAEGGNLISSPKAERRKASVDGCRELQGKRARKSLTEDSDDSDERHDDVSQIVQKKKLPK